MANTEGDKIAVPHIKIERLKRGMTQAFVALVIHMKPQRMVAIENGRRELTLAEGLQLAALFQVQPAELLGTVSLTADELAFIRDQGKQSLLHQRTRTMRAEIYPHASRVISPDISRDIL